MRLLFGIPPADGWARAAKHLGHEGHVLDYDRAFDAFALRPDVAFVQQGRETLPAVVRAANRYGVRVVVPDEPPPAADCPPDYRGGTPRPEFECDVALVGDYKPEYDRWLLPLAGSCRLKVFGPARWPVAQYLGHLPAGELPDLYASANYVLDLDGNPARVLAAWASNGHPLSVRRWEKTGVVGLDDCIHVESPGVLLNLVAAGRPAGVEPYAGLTRARDTLTHRLRELLCRFEPKPS